MKVVRLRRHWKQQQKTTNEKQKKKTNNDKISNAHYYFIEITQLKLITFYLKCSQSVNSVTEHIRPKHSLSQYM